jgi:integrase/recombinase XerD
VNTETMPEKNFKDPLADQTISVNVAALEAPTMKPIEAHVTDWLEWLRVQNFSPRTIQTYRYFIRRFVAYVKKSGLKDVRLVDRDFLRRYWRSVQTLPKPLSVHTMGSVCRVVKSLFRHLQSSGVIESDPSTILTDPSAKASLPKQAPTYADVKKILGQPDLGTMEGVRDRAWLELIFSTAIRVGECEMLLVADLDLESGVVRVRNGKGNRERLCPIGIHATRYLNLYLQQARPYYRLIAKTDWDSLFLGRHGGRLRAGDMRRMMRVYRARVGVNSLATPHGLRRAAATGMISRSGKTPADIGAVQTLLGHSRLSVTNRYAQVAGEDLKAVHNSLHPRAKTTEKAPIDKPILRFHSNRV